MVFKNGIVDNTRMNNMDTQLDTYEDLYNYAKDNGLEAVKKLLRQWVEEEQPEDWMLGFTSRALCRAASCGLEGVPIDEVPDSVMDTKNGNRLYHYMWHKDWWEL